MNEYKAEELHKLASEFEYLCAIISNHLSNKSQQIKVEQIKCTILNYVNDILYKNK